MKLAAIKGGFIYGLRVATYEIKKHSPEILIAGGIALNALSTYFSVKATAKAEQIKAEALEKSQEYKQLIDDEKADYTQEDYENDMVIVQRDKQLAMIKAYLPATALWTLSIGSFCYSNVLMRSRVKMLSLAYATVATEFATYRAKVACDAGPEKDQMYAGELIPVEYEETVIDADSGEEVKVKKYGFKEQEQVIYFDPSCRNWSPSAHYNKVFVDSIISRINTMNQTREFVVENDFFDLIGHERTERGAVDGWRFDPTGENGVQRISFVVEEVSPEDDDTCYSYKPILRIRYTTTPNVNKGA